MIVHGCSASGHLLTPRTRRRVQIAGTYRPTSAAERPPGRHHFTPDWAEIDCERRGLPPASYAAAAAAIWNRLQTRQRRATIAQLSPWISGATSMIEHCATRSTGRPPRRPAGRRSVDHLNLLIGSSLPSHRTSLTVPPLVLSREDCATEELPTFQPLAAATRVAVKEAIWKRYSP